MEKKLRRYLIFAGFLIFIIIWILILNFISPDSIVAKIGVGNSYIILFLISAIGGVSSVSASSYYLAVSVFASGGLNPLFLGLVGGVGVTIGDSLFFYLGRKGKEISSKKIHEKTNKWKKWINKSPKAFMPFLIYIYVGFTPAPNDLMTVPLGFMDYPYKRLIIPLLLGNITATVLISYISIYGVSLFF